MQQVTTTDTIHRNSDAELRQLTDDHADEYSLRCGPLYVEFSDVAYRDRVLALVPRDGDAYVTVSHDTSHRDVSDALYRELLTIGYEDDD